MQQMEFALQMKNVSKSFPGTLAVDSVDFEVVRGEVHALVGENGAGKSTLMKMLAGSFDDYTGEILVGGKAVKLSSPSRAKNCGIAMIYQELSLALPLTVAENVLVGRLPAKSKVFLDKRKMVQMAKDSLNRVGLEYLDPMTEVSEISQHEAQLVEIAKALGNEPKIIVMDEPTSALSRQEVELLFEIIEKLKNEGLSIIYISHHLSEVFGVADRVTVLRDGKKIDTLDIKDVTSEKLIEMMVGRKVAELYAEVNTDFGDTVLKVDCITRNGFFRDVSFDVRKGETLGICGLAGSGRSEIVKSICGIDPLDEGDIYIDGKKEKIRKMSSAIKKGIAYLTENRKEEGLALRTTISSNLLTALIPELSKYGIYFSSKGRKTVSDLIEKLQIYPNDSKIEVSNLSGGNQQKVLLGKWLATRPKILLLDEPTRGVDVGAKQVIHDVITELAKQGIAVVLISSDLPELVGLSSRVIIVKDGRVIGEMNREECTEESVLLAANGEGMFANVN